MTQRLLDWGRVARVAFGRRPSRRTTLTLPVKLSNQPGFPTLLLAAEQVDGKDFAFANGSSRVGERGPRHPHDIHNVTSTMSKFRGVCVKPASDLIAAVESSKIPGDAEQLLDPSGPTWITQLTAQPHSFRHASGAITRPWGRC